MAVDVLALLQKKYPTAKLCMIGPDKDGSLNKAKLLAKKRTIEDDIEFTGRLTKKQWNEKSRKFDVFINTTTIDNLPVSVIEAMALGLPVVSTNVGGIPFLIRNEENGFFIGLYLAEGSSHIVSGQVSIANNNEMELIKQQYAERSISLYKKKNQDLRGLIFNSNSLNQMVYRIKYYIICI